MATRKVGSDDAVTRSEFAGILRKNVKHFEPAQGADAREAEQLQPARWKDLIRTLERALAAQMDVYVANELQATLDRALEISRFSVVLFEGAPVLRGDLPPLPDDPDGRIKGFVGQNPWFSLAGILLSFGGAIQPRKGEAPLGTGIRDLLHDPRLMRGYQEWFDAASFQPALQNAVHATVAEARERLEQLDRDAVEAIGLIENARKSEQQWLSEANSARNNAITDIRAAWAEFYAASVQDLEATKRRVTEQSILSNAHDLWSRKARVHAFSLELASS